MILRSADFATLCPAEGRGRPVETLRLSQAGGLTQIGIYLQRLWPGADTGAAHWHSAEDEFLYVTEGMVTISDDDGLHDLGPGDAAVWRAGVANAHQVRNRSAAPCGYIIAGTRIARDICTYPASGHRQINAETTWEVLDADGRRLRGGDLPAELLNLRADWTRRPAPGARLQRIVRQAAAGGAARDAAGASAGGRVLMQDYTGEGGVAQFSAVTQTLLPAPHPSPRLPVAPPGAGDAFLMVLEGALTVREGAEPFLLQAGDVACWAEGDARDPHIATDADVACRALVIRMHRPETA
ncbi:cupin domain-containing protein [Phaeovulum sp. W22_SRMD_FR3]|uniref:cupin domain-containing protein n=1 Tax=Phaeovulum sp. W22_SRMD_FR3 TaxID=3240274 RepID=UPI003F9ADE9A